MSLSLLFSPTWNSSALLLAIPGIPTLFLFPGPLSISLRLYFEFSESKWNLTVGKTLRSHFVSEKLRLAKAKWLACEHPPQPHSFPGLGWEDGNWVWPNITMAETAAVGHFLSQAGNRLCFHDMFYTRNSEKYDTSDFKKQYEILKIHFCACKPAFPLSVQKHVCHFHGVLYRWVRKRSIFCMLATSFFFSQYCLWDPSMFIGIDPGRSYICTNLLIHSVLWLRSLSSWWISRVFPSFQLPRLPFKRNNHPAQIESCDYNWIGEEVSDCWQEHEVVSCLACAFLYRKCNWAEPRKSCDLG